MAEIKTYRDGFRDGWQEVTDLPLGDWALWKTGYAKGLADGRRGAELMLQTLYRSVPPGP